RPSVRHRRPARRGHPRRPERLAQPVPEADRATPVLALWTDAARPARADGTPARAALRRSNTHRLDQGRHALGREHPEGDAGPGAVVRAAGRGLPQAHLRARRQDDRHGERHDPEPRPWRRRGARDLDRPGRAPGDLRPDRRPVAWPHRRGRREPARGRRTGRPAHGRRRARRGRRLLAETSAPASDAAAPGRGNVLLASLPNRLFDVVIRSVVPVILALVAGGLLLLALGRNPVDFYRHVWDYGVAGGNWQQSAVTMVPLLLIAVGLTVIFRANIWNLGYNGQFALGAALVAGYGPSLVNDLPLWFAFVLLALLAAAVGAAWTLVPALLKAWYGTNEIITTLMMSFVGVDLADYLI